MLRWFLWLAALRTAGGTILVDGGGFQCPLVGGLVAQVVDSLPDVELVGASCGAWMQTYQCAHNRTAFRSAVVGGFQGWKRAPPADWLSGLRTLLTPLDFDGACLRRLKVLVLGADGGTLLTDFVDAADYFDAASVSSHWPSFFGPSTYRGRAYVDGALVPVDALRRRFDHLVVARHNPFLGLPRLLDDDDPGEWARGRTVGRAVVALQETGARFSTVPVF